MRPMNSSTTLPAVIAAALLFATTAPRAQTARSILDVTGVTEGLCVHVGCGDGSLTVDLGNDSRMVVHALALTSEELAKTRQRVAVAGKQGLITAERVAAASRLPYATNLVNLLVADMDALGSAAPPLEEIERVVAPMGVARLKMDGVWTSMQIPVTPGMDTEFQTHEYDATGNPVSRDQLAGPATSLQWISDYGWTNAWGVRLTKGGMYYVTQWRSADRTWFRYRCGRNAWNGVLRWSERGNLSEKMPFIAANGTVYTVTGMGSRPREGLTYGGPVIAIDGITGEIKHTYTEAGLIDEQPMSMTLEYFDGTLLVTNRDSLYAFDASGGALKWSHSEGPGKGLWWPTVDPQRRTVMVGVGTYKVPDQGFWGTRFPNSPMDSILCFDLETGREVWRNTEIGTHEGTPGILGTDPPVRDPVYSRKSLYRPAYHDGRLYIACQIPQGQYFDSTDYARFPKARAVSAAGVHEHGYVAMLNTETGAIGWGLDAHYWFQLPVQISANWGTINYHHYGAVRMLDPTGSKRAYTTQPTGSDISGDADQQCNRTLMTPNYLLTSSTAFYKRTAPGQFGIMRQFITRGACADQAYPANGMLYYVSGMCNCNWAWLRGAMALSSEPVGEPVGDASRLQKGAAFGEALPSAQYPLALPSAETPLSYWGIQDPSYGRFGAGPSVEPAPNPVWTGAPLRDDWLNNNVFFTSETPPVSSGGLSFVAKVHQHVVEARDGTGAAVWTFEAGGRVSSAPVVHKGLILFGAHDGWVYALRASDGALVWRCLAAPYHHNIVAYGQVESAWPVYGVVVHEGALYYSAGRHPELNGGIWVGRLAPETGQADWRTVVRRTAAWRPNNTNGGQLGVREYSLMNTVPAVKEGRLAIRGARFDLATGRLEHANPEYVTTVFTGTLDNPVVRSQTPPARATGSEAAIRLAPAWFELSAPGRARVTVCDVRGRTLTVAYDGDAPVGRTAITPRLDRFAAGYYVLHLRSDAQAKTRVVLSMKEGAE